MNQSRTLPLIALLSVFLFPGCGAADATSTAVEQPQDQALMVQRPEREPDMMGMVSDMVGNQFTILLFNEEDLPFGGMRPDGNATGTGSFRQQGQESSFNPSRVLGTAGGSGGGMFGGPGMGGGLRGGQRPDGQTFDREAMQAARDEMMKELKAKSTGSETITIPVGIPIIGGMRPGGPNGGEPQHANQLSFSDIKKDSLITVWLNQEIQDKKAAEFVMLMGGSRPTGGSNAIQQ